MPRQIWIVLRTPREGEPREGRELERAIAIGAALARGAFRESAAVGLAVPAGDIALPPQSSPRALRSMLDQLAVLDGGSLEAEFDFPASSVRSAASVVVHAGEIDRGFGSSRSYHVSAMDPGDVLAPGEELERALALLDSPDPNRKVDP